MSDKRISNSLHKWVESNQNTISNMIEASTSTLKVGNNIIFCVRKVGADKAIEFDHLDRDFLFFTDGPYSGLRNPETKIYAGLIQIFGF